MITPRSAPPDRDHLDRERPAPSPRRRLPRSTSGRLAVALVVAFLALWAVFAVRAVDRNRDAVSPPTPADVSGAPIPDLRATFDAALRRIPVPDRPYLVSDRPLDTLPSGTPASPLASPATSPVASPTASP